MWYIMRTKKLLRRVRRFLCREDGPTTVEYAVMLMLIVLGLITALQIIGNSSAGSFNATADGMSDALNDR